MERYRLVFLENLRILGFLVCKFLSHRGNMTFVINSGFQGHDVNIIKVTDKIKEFIKIWTYGRLQLEK